MSRSKIKLNSSSDWTPALFPVVTRPVTDLLPEYQVRATDRQNLIIGNGNVIYGFQGMGYTLIPNQLIYEIVNEVIGEHEVSILHNSRGEFSFNVHLPSTQYNIGSRTDTLQKSLIINNSYNGRSHFTVQGKVVGTATDQVRERGMRVSYYRQICSNGLMGWADEFMSMDQYLNWLMMGQPKSYEDALDVQTFVDNGIEQVEREEEELLRKTFKHKSLDVELFASNLRCLLKKFINKQDSLTLKAYERLANERVEKDEISHLLGSLGLPKRLVQPTIERLEVETRELKTPENAWLVMNAVNHSIFSNNSGLSIEKRYELDRQMFHNINGYFM